MITPEVHVPTTFIPTDRFDHIPVIVINTLPRSVMLNSGVAVANFQLIIVIYR
jgi:hypothetical protein